VFPVAVEGEGGGRREKRHAGDPPPASVFKGGEKGREMRISVEAIGRGKEALLSLLRRQLTEGKGGELRLVKPLREKREGEKGKRSLVSKGGRGKILGK